MLVRKLRSVVECDVIACVLTSALDTLVTSTLVVAVGGVEVVIGSWVTLKASDVVEFRIAESFPVVVSSSDAVVVASEADVEFATFSNDVEVELLVV